MEKNNNSKRNPENRKQQFNKRFNALKTEHQKFVSAGKDLSDFINPTRGIFNGDRTKIGKMIDHKKLLNSHATHALRIFASGLNSGMTNKSSQWFRMTFGDEKYFDIPGSREWLDSVQNLMYDVLSGSNIYGSFYSTYEELGEFATGCFSILEDFDDAVRAKSFTFGEYYLGIDNKGRVNAFARDFEMTVDQLITEFGYESCSAQIRGMYDNNQIDVKIKCQHLIEANDTRMEGYDDFKNMPFRSAYWEASSASDDEFLAIRGFKRFPIIAPRWDTITTDMVYGYGPGWHALGAVKELQKTRLDKLLAQEKIHNPPMMSDGTVPGHTNILPGGITKTSGTSPNTGIRPAYQINPNLQSYIELMQEEKDEIDRFFFVNLFLMLMNIDKTNMTATEVAERQQEKIMMLGPALHRLDEEMLTPTLELVYGILEDNMLIPPPPEGIQGLPIKIEFVSMLAQAQKALGITQIERVIGFVANVSPISPSIVDNINMDEAIREVARLEGSPAKIIFDRNVVDETRKEREIQRKQAVALEAGKTTADATKKLANAPLNTGSALDAFLEKNKGTIPGMK